MSDCCRVGGPEAEAPTGCPECGRPGREVDRVTLKALLRASALERLGAPAHRFCPTPSCPVVYFGRGERFEKAEVAVAVFQKEREGERLSCYCLELREGGIRREIEETGGSTVVERITRLVQSGRCACELRNPQGSCCLGNVTAVVKAAEGRVREAEAPLVNEAWRRRCG